MPSDRFLVSSLGEYYEDCLTVEAKIKNRTKALEASSLLCAKLGEREGKREKMVAYLARKRGLTYEEMWDKLLDPDYKLTRDEVQELEVINEEES